MESKVYESKCYEGLKPRILVTADFIEKNKFHLNKTQDEIRKKYDTSNSFIGSYQEVLLSYMDFYHCKNLYKDDYIKQVESGEKNFDPPITDILETTQDFLDYLNFGYTKALDQRGISAGRTIEKLSAWLWLLGREDLEIIINSSSLYNPYGMPALIRLTEELGLEVPQECRDFAEVKV